MQPHIKRELKNCDFDLYRLQALLNKGEQNLARKRSIQDAIFAHPELQKLPSYYSLSRPQKMKHILKTTNIFIFQVVPRLGLKLSLADIATAFLCAQGQLPIAVHYFMFYVTISALASKEQFEYWIPKIKNIDIMGCYAQTQLGHGSNVRGLQTTATYDTKTKQFVINSPTTSSAKFWPGELGKFATHAILAARLIIKGKDYGPQMFIIQIRSTQTHDLLKGVEAGDIGTKHGYQTKDNGYAIFTNYRVPRSSLLEKFFTIDDEKAQFKVIGNPKAAYFTMMMNRVGIVSEAKTYLSQVLTIALRYSAYRKQFQTIDDSKDERAVIDYQYQQYRLTPILAEAFTFHFLGDKIIKMYNQVRDELVVSGSTKKLGELHRIISGLKAFITWKTFESVDQCRAACGGHGYLEISGISQRVLDYSARTVYQGENAVMTQQTSMALFKMFRKIIEGKERASLDENMRYLFDLHNSDDKGKMKSVNKEEILKAFRRRAYHSISETATKMMSLVQSGKSMNTVFNEFIQKDALIMTKHHCEAFIYDVFYRFLADVESGVGQKLEKSLIVHLNRLLIVYGLKTLLHDISPLYRCQYIEGANEIQMEKRLMEEIKQLRPMLLPLIEGFAWPDEILNSAIGSKTKDPYEEILRCVRHENSLNKTEKLDGFEQFVRPILRAKL